MDAAALALLTDQSSGVALDAVQVPDTWRLQTAEYTPVKQKTPSLEYTSVTRKFSFRDDVVVVTAGLDSAGAVCEVFIYAPTLTTDLAQALSALAQLLSLTQQFCLPLSDIKAVFTSKGEQHDTVNVLVSEIMTWLSDKFDARASTSLDTISAKI